MRTAAQTADVFKAGVLAATLQRTPGGVEFRYLDRYREGRGRPIASTLPLSAQPLLLPAGAIPPFFAGLLPEGRRLTALRQSVKTSADDELGLLLAVGDDTIGDVQVVPGGRLPAPDVAGLSLVDPAELHFSDLMRSAGIADRPALAGVQDKASAAMLSLPVKRRGERFILKLDPPEYAELVRNEAFFIDLARSARIPVVQAHVIVDADERPGLLVQRFDRAATDGEIRQVAVEDAAQAAGVWPADKYNLTFERAADALLAVTRAPAIGALRLLEQLVFAWLTGNGDMHAKNLSIFEAVPGEYRVTPAYDLPSTLFYGDTTLALTVGGRDTLTARRFVDCAGDLAVPPRAARRILIDALRATERLDERVESGALPFDRRTNAKAARRLAARHGELLHGAERL